MGQETAAELLLLVKNKKPIQLIYLSIHLHFFLKEINTSIMQGCVKSDNKNVYC